MTDDPRFTHDRYLIRRKVLKLVGGAFHIYDTRGRLVLYSSMKAFKLREDIRLYGDESMREEILVISARTWADISTIYDVTDRNGQRIGSLQRRGLKSVLRDEWTIMDPSETVVATIREDSAALAFLRRTILEILPQRYHVKMGDLEVATMQQNFNPFVYKLELDFSMDLALRLDRRLGIAGGILLAAIEGKQG